MRVQDLSETPGSAVIDADVCIIGSGPAGLTVARELAGSGLRVVLLESGGLDETPAADALNEIESVGAPRVLDQTIVRNRILGGTSHTWSGRAVVFDPIDFSPREWVPGSGWPITRQELLPFFARAQEHLGAPVADNTASSFVDAVTEGCPTPDRDRLVPYAWALSRDAANPKDSMRFGPRALQEPMPGVECFLRATATQVEVDAQGTRVTGVAAAAADGSTRRITAPLVVVAGGAIENARLLLASNRVLHAGVGNRHDQVGRYLMDHLRGAVGRFAADDDVLQRVFGDRFLDGGARATPGYALSPALQQRERLLNCALWVFPRTSPADPFTLVARARSFPSGTAAAARAAIRDAPRLLEGGWRLAVRRRAPVRRLESLELHVIVEQRPDPESRVTLSTRRDALGMPLSRIDWRVNREEIATVGRTTHLVVEQLAAAGLPRPALLPFIEDPAAPFHLLDVAHPMGTTRMADDPRNGVVDRDCAVHGVEGLYVAGSSVFPTGGHANPTQMLVALAVRLADLLKARARQPVPETETADGFRSLNT